ncbi:MAG: T9SS type A sorting domain-containing protein [Phaeodactylibacter sp.]|nr:T9SS type A sorting domain-containing protein [Phaeodactylibacter sp.]MCB9303092.1 T9SS type A sorting domain-containing protein [Lewinellaceae bacterium]HQU57732.1 T9SS type A sorting domain-containing protein [Saprospiraceae bacterium]
MKQTLLLSFFFLLSLSVAYSQTSFSSRLTLKKPGDTEKVDLQVYPNPATDYISVTNGESVAKVMVFNLVGRQMKAFDTAEGDKFFVGDLPRGMYLVQLLSAKEQILTTQRVNKR